MAFTVPKKGRTISRNAHLPERTSREIDAVVPIIQEQNHAAIQAKGFPIYIYQRMTLGRKCPCSLHSKISPLQADLYDDAGVASDAQLQAIMDASRFSIEDYNADSTNPKQNRDVNAEFNELGVEDTEYDIPISLQSDAFSAGACPICLGTGYIGGYTCLEATRLVLTATDISTSSATELGDDYPNTITMSLNNSYVDFNVTLPKLPPNTKARLRVFNGFDLQRGVILVKDNNQYRPYTGSETGSVILRILKEHFKPSEIEVFSFTHIEIMLPTVTRPDYADIPNLVNNYDPLKVYPYQSTTMSLSPIIPALKAQDVIADVQHGLLWLVTSASPTYAANGQIWHQNIECRVIEPYEAAHNLLIPDVSWLDANKVTNLTPGVGRITRFGGY